MLERYRRSGENADRKSSLRNFTRRTPVAEGTALGGTIYGLATDTHSLTAIGVAAGTYVLYRGYKELKDLPRRNGEAIQAELEDKFGAPVQEVIAAAEAILKQEKPDA